MGLINDLTNSMVREIFRRLRALENASPMNSGAIGRGGFEVYDGGVITISNGGLYVTGTAEIIGRLVASGIVNFTGEVTITGPLEVSGLTHLMSDLVVASGGRIVAGSIVLNPDGSAKFGSMTISPTGKITSGSAEINPDGSAKFGNLTINAAGVITSGNVLLDPSASNGGFTFVSGGGVGGNGGGVVVKGVGNAGFISDTTAAIFAGASQLTVGDGYVRVDGLPTISGKTANLYQDPITRLIYRIV